MLGWLALVAVIFLAGQRWPQNVNSYDAGQSGQAEQTLNRLGTTTPPPEKVLIQARGPGAPGASPPTRRCGRRPGRSSPR